VVGVVWLGVGVVGFVGLVVLGVQLSKLLDTVAAVVRPSGHTSIAT
jgi:hypothetical protein